jgi:hypothetical protein
VGVLRSLGIAVSRLDSGATACSTHHPEGISGEDLRGHVPQEEIDPTFGGRQMQSSDNARGTSRCCVGHGNLGREEPTGQFCRVLPANLLDIPDVIRWTRLLSRTWIRLRHC